MKSSKINRSFYISQKKFYKIFINQRHPPPILKPLYSLTKKFFAHFSTPSGVESKLKTPMFLPDTHYPCPIYL